MQCATFNGQRRI